MAKEYKELVVGLDIGTSKVMVVVAEVLPGAELKLAGFGIAPSSGLKRGVVVNIDATVILETPKVNPHIEQMQVVLAGILNLATDEISIKATTHEKVDSFGEKRAIKAYAAALLYQL